MRGYDPRELWTRLQTMFGTSTPATAAKIMQKSMTPTGGHEVMLCQLASQRLYAIST